MKDEASILVTNLSISIMLVKAHHRQNCGFNILRKTLWMMINGYNFGLYGEQKRQIGQVSAMAIKMEWICSRKHLNETFQTKRNKTIIETKTK